MNSDIKRRAEAHRTPEGMTEQIAKDMFDRLQLKILRRSKHFADHIDGLEVRLWDIIRKLNCFGGNEKFIDTDFASKAIQRLRPDTGAGV